MLESFGPVVRDGMGWKPKESCGLCLPALPLRGPECGDGKPDCCTLAGGSSRDILVVGGEYDGRCGPPGGVVLQAPRYCPAPSTDNNI